MATYLDMMEGMYSMNHFPDKSMTKAPGVGILEDRKRGLEKIPGCGSTDESSGWDLQSRDQGRIRL